MLVDWLGMVAVVGSLAMLDWVAKLSLLANNRLAARKIWVERGMVSLFKVGYGLDHSSKVDSFVRREGSMHFFPGHLCDAFFLLHQNPRADDDSP